ncbi:MAG: hypothetical protein ACLTSX_00795 [Collinsella sp.]
MEGAVSTCKVDLTGRSRRVGARPVRAPRVGAVGRRPVAKAAEIARSAGLDVIADASPYRLSTAWTFGLDNEDGDSKLDAVNDLLEIAGFSSAATDPMGRVLMRRYVPRASASPSMPSQRERTRGSSAP